VFASIEANFAAEQGRLRRTAMQSACAYATLRHVVTGG
jgi:hypothetical protein